MRRSHPLSDQFPGEYTGQRLPHLGFPVSAMNLFGMYIFHQSPSSARYSFYQPMEEWKDELTCQQWGLNSPPFTQESDALLTELLGFMGFMGGTHKWLYSACYLERTILLLGATTTPIQFPESTARWS